MGPNNMDPRPHPHWTRREKHLSKLGQANPFATTVLYTLHAEQHDAHNWDLAPFCCVVRRASCVAWRVTRAVSSVDKAQTGVDNFQLQDSIFRCVLDFSDSRGSQEEVLFEFRRLYTKNNAACHLTTQTLVHSCCVLQSLFCTQKNLFYSLFHLQHLQTKCVHRIRKTVCVMNWTLF